MPVHSILLLSLRELGWIDDSDHLAWEKSIEAAQACRHSAEFASQSTSPGCWLSWILSGNLSQVGGTSPAPFPKEKLTPHGRRQLQSLVQAGWRLVDRWPKATGGILETWLGRRFYLGRAEYLNSHQQYSAIVSSQLGRHFSRQPLWPQLLDWALRAVHRDHACLLLVPGTTLYNPSSHFAKAGGLRSLELSLPRQPHGDDRQIADWLVEHLKLALTPASRPETPESLSISPAWQSGPGVSDLSRFSIRDRFAIGLADRILTLAIRPGGNVAGLLKHRLRTGQFPIGSVFIALQNISHAPQQAHTLQQAHTPRQSQATPRTRGQSIPDLVPWLDQGAVGWVVLLREGDLLKNMAVCRPDSDCSTGTASARHCGAKPTILQMCAAASSLWRKEPVQWHNLTHCTRGSLGPLPHESPAAHLDRLWQAGSALPNTPLWTLIRILREQRLRGTTWLIRGNQPSVSLSAVPLKELLGRRHFQAHLGRWDWEPYGIMFHQGYLPQARPVLYAKPSEFLRLPEADRVYFQPQDSKYDWSQEREWRVVGDLDLRSMPAEAATVFVRSQLEAVQLARESRFPVIWTEGILP